MGAPMVNSASARKLRRHNLMRLRWRIAPRVFIGCAATSVLLALFCMNIFREPSVTEFLEEQKRSREGQQQGALGSTARGWAARGAAEDPELEAARQRYASAQRGAGNASGTVHHRWYTGAGWAGERAHRRNSSAHRNGSRLFRWYAGGEAEGEGVGAGARVTLANATVQGSNGAVHNSSNSGTVQGAGVAVHGGSITKGEGGGVTAGGSLVLMGAQALHWELRRSMFPLLFSLAGAADGDKAHQGYLWAVGGGAGEKGREGKEGERRPWQEEVVKKIEKWSQRPSSLCFGHGNVTIVTVTVGLPQEYVILMRKNRLHYCSLIHHCRYCDIPVNLDSSRPVTWTKVKAMQLVLSFSDTVVYMDADALIVNTSISFPSLLASLDGAYSTSTKDIVYTTDFQSGRATEPTPYSLINSGVYIVRSTNWTKAFLEVQYRYYRSTIFHKSGDQEAVMLYRRKHRGEFLQHAALIPYRYMNVPCGQKYNEYVRGDFIVHYAGGHSRDKYQRLSRMFLEPSGKH